MATTPLREALQGIETEIAAGRPGEALRLCDHLLTTRPRWLDAQRLRARALVATDRLPEAERVLDGILASNPEDGDAFCDRAYLMQRRGELLGALACYRRACELLRNNAGLRAAHNQLANQLGRPPYTPSHTGLARLYLRAELFAHALREWDIALQANPNRLDAQIGMAETLWRSGDNKRAQTTSRYILGRMPLSLKPLLLLAFFHLEEGRTAEAHEMVQLAGELDPDQRVAGELFGDLVASGHAGLAQLFRAAVRSKTSPLLAPEAAAGQTGVFPTLVPSLSRPISEPLTTGQLPTGPLFTDSRPNYASLPTGKLTYPPVQDTGEIEDFFSQSRAAMLPDNFDMVFRETEYMLWSRDNEEPTTAEIPVITADTPPPPPSAETDMAFVRWLQEQGARPIAGAAPVSDLPALPPSSTPQTPVELPPFLRQALAESVPLPALPPSQDRERAAPSGNGHVGASDSPPNVPPAPWLLADGAEPVAPTTDAAPLHQGDAPLGGSAVPAFPLAASSAVSPPPTSAEPPALAEATNAEPPPPTMPLPIVAPSSSFAESLPPVLPPVAESASLSASPATSEPQSVSEPPPALQDPYPAIEPPTPPEMPVAPAPEPAPVAQNPSPNVPSEGEAPPVTMEAIQQGLTSAGFARLETGRLAAVASSLTPSNGDAPPAASDITQQLEKARTLRRNGRLGEALVEYRSLVKAITDRMPEIIRDLRDAAIEAPQEPEVHRLLGDAYIREGDYVEALESYNRASQLRQDEGTP